MKISSTDEEALRINAMLQGISLDEMMAELCEDDDIEIEIEDEKPKKKSSGSKKKTNAKEKNNTIFSVPELDIYKKLPKDLSITVEYKEHTIPYKEQLWNIDRRIADYKIELVNIAKVARDISEKFGKDIEKGKELASLGKTRYYKVVNYDMCIPYALRELGYIKVFVKNKQFRTSVYIDAERLKKNNVDPFSVLKSVKKVAKSIEAVS